MNMSAQFKWYLAVFCFPWVLIRRGGRAALAILICIGTFASHSAWAQTDTTPPVLKSLSFSSSIVDVTNGPQTLTVSLTITDDLSGVNFTSLTFGYVEFSLRSPSGTQVLKLTNQFGGTFTLVNGTTLNGVWQRALTIPQFSESGVWTVASIEIPDSAQNTLVLNTSQLAAGGFPTTLTVVSNQDLTPPTVLGLSMTPSSFDVSKSPQPVTLNLTLSDSPAGAIFPGGNQLALVFQISSPSGNQSQWLATNQFALTSGPTQAGTWAATFTIPQFSEPGTWTIKSLTLQDAANNSEALNAASIQALGFSPQIAVSDSSSDSLPPKLTGFSFSPATLDTSIGSQTVTATIQATDDLSGVSFSFATPNFTFAYGPVTTNPTSTKQILTFTCHETGGTPVNGTWQCPITFPAFADAGSWTIRNVTLKDAATNTITYTTAQLQASGFPTTITVVPPTTGAVFFGGGGSTINPTALVAEPVNSATGNYFSAHVDMAVRGRGLNFQFARYYNSLDTYSGPLGVGWNHTYNIILSVNQPSGQVTVRQSDGSTILFTPAGSGKYVPATIGLFDSLVQSQNGTLTLTRKNQTKLTFSPSGQLIQISDRNGNVQSLNYTSDGNLVTVTDTSGRAFRLAYDSTGHLISLTDPSGRIVAYSYDVIGNLVSFTDPLGITTQYQYDNSHHLTSGIDGRGITYVQNTYDPQGRVMVQKNGLAAATNFKYNTPSPGTTTVVDPQGNSTQYVYDSTIRLVKIINAQGGTTSYAYDANNEKTAITNANGKTTSFTYDGNGNVTNVADALGNTASFTYDARNDLLSTTNASGAKTTFSYDSHGNLLTTNDALGNITSFAYDAFGEPVSRSDANGNTTIMTYDSAGDLQKVTNPLGNATVIGYDVISRLIALTDANGHTSTVAYDALSRRIKATDALGDQTRWSYDADGNLLKVVDADGNPTSYQYDSVNNLIGVTDALGNKTAYSYDANNNRTSFTNVKGKSTTSGYDSLNRRVKTTDPLGFTAFYSYDAVGNVVSIKDANGNVDTFAVDALNRTVKRTYADGNVISYAYSANGNRTSMVDAHGTTSYAYDALNRITSVTNAGGTVVRYGYDGVGHRTSLTYADGRVVSYFYDAAERMSQVKDWLGRITAYAYDATGNRTGIVMGNGAGSTSAYDAANRLASIVNRGKQVLTSFSYILDAAGNRTQMTDSAGGVTHYGYDALNRLTSWTPPSGQTTAYIYDAAGNRTSMVNAAITTYTYDDDDRTLTAGSSSFTYDANGNRLTKTTGGTTNNFVFDALNRLTQVTGGGISASYQYDGDGNRIAHQVGTSSYQYTLDVVRRNTTVLNENGADGNIDFQYGLSLLSGNSASLEQFYQTDGVGSTADVTDGNENLKANYTYDPWGKLVTPLDPLGTKDKFKFGGEALDPQTGLYYLRARYYDPTIGRFISKDPLAGSVSFPLSRNRYAYALANPLRYTDPLGLASDSFGGDQGAARSGAIFGLIYNISPETDLSSSLSDYISYDLGGYTGPVVSGGNSSASGYDPFSTTLSSQTYIGSPTGPGWTIDDWNGMQEQLACTPGMFGCIPATPTNPGNDQSDAPETSGPLEQQQPGPYGNPGPPETWDDD